MKSIRLDTVSECTICMAEFEEPCTITVLGCHESHFFHDDCLKYWMDAEKKKNIKCTCPICRREIDESKMENQAYKGLNKKGDDTHEMFGLEKPTEQKMKGSFTDFEI